MWARVLIAVLVWKVSVDVFRAHCMVNMAWTSRFAGICRGFSFSKPISLASMQDLHFVYIMSLGSYFALTSNVFFMFLWSTWINKSLWVSAWSRVVRGRECNWRFPCCRCRLFLDIYLKSFARLEVTQQSFTLWREVSVNLLFVFLFPTKTFGVLMTNHLVS